MNKFLIFFSVLFSFLISSYSYGFRISVDTQKDLNQVYTRTLNITCANGEENLCYTLCNHQRLCQREEPLCLNCAGTTSELMRVIFTQLTSLYEVAPTPVKKTDLFNYIDQDRLVILDSQSLFNFYTNISKNASGPLFLSLCPAQTVKAFIGLQLDENGFPEHPSFLICESPLGQQTISRLQGRDGYQPPPLKESLHFDLNLKLGNRMEMKGLHDVKHLNSRLEAKPS